MSWNRLCALGRLGTDDWIRSLRRGSQRLDLSRQNRPDQGRTELRQHQWDRPQRQKAFDRNSPRAALPSWSLPAPRIAGGTPGPSRGRTIRRAHWNRTTRALLSRSNTACSFLALPAQVRRIIRAANAQRDAMVDGVTGATAGFVACGRAGMRALEVLARARAAVMPCASRARERKRYQRDETYVPGHRAFRSKDGSLPAA